MIIDYIKENKLNYMMRRGYNNYITNHIELYKDNIFYRIKFYRNGMMTWISYKGNKRLEKRTVEVSQAQLLIDCLEG